MNGWLSNQRYRARLLRQERQPLNVPGKMMDRVLGRQNPASRRRKRKANQTVAGDFQAGVAFRSDLHDAAAARERSRHIQISDRVKGQTLRSSQAAEKFVHVPLRINSVDAIKARRSR